MSWVNGQPVVRAASAIMLVIAAVFGPRPRIAENKAIWTLLLAAIGLVMLQLMPLPPSWWQNLPGRAPFAEAALASGQLQPWRPIAIVPGDAINAAASLIVPLAVLVLLSGTKLDERAMLPGLLLAVATGAALVGLIQFTGADLTNPFVNAEPGSVDGLFANRNHFALLLATGCVAAPTWVFGDAPRTSRSRRDGTRWRGLVAFALVILFTLVILASGSRAGIVLGLLGIVGGVAIAQRELARGLRRYPRWVMPTLVSSVVAVIGVVGLVSVMAGRAISIDRILAVAYVKDIRVQNFPVVLEMVREYFPLGSGFGGFDPLFRMHEPMQSLVPDYFNHAHNDFVEIVIDGGLAGLMIMIGALAWWGRASVRVWRTDQQNHNNGENIAGRMGSLILLLIIVASVADYPARTPIIMAVIIIAAVCLNARPSRTALPASDQRLEERSTGVAGNHGKPPNQ